MLLDGIQSRHKEPGGETVAAQPVLSDDGHRQQVGFGGIAGSGVENVVIPLAVLLKVPLIAARGANHLVVHDEGAVIVGGAAQRVPQADDKILGTAVLGGLLTGGGHIAAQGNQGALYAAFLVELQHLLDTIALDGGAEVQRHTGPVQVNRQVFVVHRHIFHAHIAEGRADLISRGNRRRLPANVPQLHQRANGGVKHPAGFSGKVHDLAENIVFRRFQCHRRNAGHGVDSAGHRIRRPGAPLLFQLFQKGCCLGNQLIRTLAAGLLADIGIHDEVLAGINNFRFGYTDSSLLLLFLNQHPKQDTRRCRCCQRQHNSQGFDNHSSFMESPGGYKPSRRTALFQKAGLFSENYAENGPSFFVRLISPAGAHKNSKAIQFILVSFARCVKAK